MAPGGAGKGGRGLAQSANAIDALTFGYNETRARPKLGAIAGVPTDPALAPSKKSVEKEILAEHGKDEAKVRTLRRGKMPIYEPGLEEIVVRNTGEKRLTFTTQLAKAVRQSTIIFIAVGTPQGEDGSADLQHVKAVARDIARAMNGYKVIVDKSTVP
ncbi:UDP-glucose/GDP-mannose dehydrogenase family protein, partial [Lacticaseibacillus rhamnosus]